MKRLICSWKSELDNLKNDNVNIYDRVESDINNINQIIEEIKNEINDKDDDFSFESLEDANTNLIYTNIMTNISYIESEANEISNYISDAKDNGIKNEDALREGRNIIDDLEKEFVNLKNEIEKIANNNGNLRSEINDLLDQINNIRNDIDNIQSNSSESRLKKGMEKKAGRVFICYAHDAIIKNAKNIYKICNDFNLNIVSDIYDLITKIEGNIDGIESDIDEAREMNERMGNGIDEKNERIDDLRDEIKEIEDELAGNNEDKDDLEYQLKDLKEILSNLENELSNYGG